MLRACVPCPMLSLCGFHLKKKIKLEDLGRREGCRNALDIAELAAVLGACRGNKENMKNPSEMMTTSDLPC